MCDGGRGSSDGECVMVVEVVKMMRVRGDDDGDEDTTESFVLC